MVGDYHIRLKTDAKPFAVFIPRRGIKDRYDCIGMTVTSASSTTLSASQNGTRQVTKLVRHQTRG